MLKTHQKSSDSCYNALLRDAVAKRVVFPFLSSFHDKFHMKPQFPAFWSCVACKKANEIVTNKKIFHYKHSEKNIIQFLLTIKCLSNVLKPSIYNSGK